MERKQSSINTFFVKKRKRDDDETESVAGSSSSGQVHTDRDRVPTAEESKTADQLQQPETTSADVVINDVIAQRPRDNATTTPCIITRSQTTVRVQQMPSVRWAFLGTAVMSQDVNHGWVGRRYLRSALR